MHLHKLFLQAMRSSERGPRARVARFRAAKQTVRTAWRPNFGWVREQRGPAESAKEVHERRQKKAEAGPDRGASCKVKADK